MVYICAAISAFYIISKYFEIMIYNFADDVFILMILFGFGLIALNHYAFEKINLEIKKVRHDKQ